MERQRRNNEQWPKPDVALQEQQQQVQNLGTIMLCEPTPIDEIIATTTETITTADPNNSNRKIILYECTDEEEQSMMIDILQSLRTDELTPNSNSSLPVSVMTIQNIQQDSSSEASTIIPRPCSTSISSCSTDQSFPSLTATSDQGLQVNNPVVQPIPTNLLLSQLQQIQALSSQIQTLSRQPPTFILPQPPTTTMGTAEQQSTNDKTTVKADFQSSSTSSLTSFLQTTPSVSRTKLNNNKKEKKSSKNINNDNTKIVKPQTAYHWFFFDERQRLMNEVTTNVDNNTEKVIQQGDTTIPYHPKNCTLDVQYMNELLYRYYKHISIKRKHRKIEGSIKFHTLSKIIGYRWRNLSVEGRLFYSTIAEHDKKRYEYQMKTTNNNKQITTTTTTTENT